MPSAAACPHADSDPPPDPSSASTTRAPAPEPVFGAAFAGPAEPPPTSRAAAARGLAELARAGFRRYATYRQATAAGVFTNVVFGAMLAAILTSVAAAGGGRPGGYTAAQLMAFVWVGQGLLNVTYVWGWKELADRVATGDIAADLLRPIGPLAAYAAADLGRAGHAAFGRFVVPVAVGIVGYDMYLPRRVSSYALFAVSVVLAVLLSFAGRYLVNLSAFWLLDARGPVMLWVLMLAPLSGSYFPLRFLPEWAQWLLWCGTPFPGVFQVPLDIAVERTSGLAAAGTVLLQLAWVGALFGLCAAVQRRAVRRLVVQGG